MLVFLDVASQKIKIYSEAGLDEYMFDEIDEVADFIGKKQFLYVTNAMYAKAEQLVDVVSEMMSAGLAPVDTGGFNLDEMDRDSQYLQSCTPGVLVIEDIGVKFEGPGDCKIIDEEIYELMQESNILRSLIKNGKVKIVDHKTMLKSSRKQNRIKQRFMKLRAEQDEKELNSIIMDTSSPGSALRAAEQGISYKDDRNDVHEDDVTDSILREERMIEKLSPEQLDAYLRSGQLAP